MSGKQHAYKASVEWTGNLGAGTESYKAFSRNHIARAAGKPDILCSSDPAFRGDAARWNPEDLLVASVSACHKLWYLHLAATNGISVQAYIDEAEGVMVEDAAKGGYFTSITLRPRVTIRASDDGALAETLHHQAHEKCFIANSLNFPVECEPVTVRAG